MKLVRHGPCISAAGLLVLLALCSCAGAPPAAPEVPAPAEPAEPAVSTVPAPGSGIPNPADLIPHKGRRIFLSGMNLAWMDFARDLDRFNEAAFTAQVENIASAGGNCIRWWIFVNGTRSPVFGEDGLVKELPMEQILVLKRALDIAFERGVGLIPCLWSFDMLQGQTGVDQARNTRLLEDPAAAKAFIDNALIPMVRKLKNHPGLIAWEVFNEPEGMLPSFGWTPKRTTMEAVQAFINRVSGAIHGEAPDNLVTNGSWSIQVLTDANGLINYYRDDRLIAAGGDPKGTLDFYCVHYYPEYFDEALSPFHNPKNYWELDKPLVIAEFPSKGIVPIKGRERFAPKTRLTTEDTYRFAMENGYAGALSWTMTNHDGFGGFYQSAEGMAGISMDYGDFITLDRTGLDRGPQVVKPIKDLILNVSRKDWPNLLSLTDYIQDPEDGSKLNFITTAAGDPAIAKVAVAADGKVSVTLSGTGALGSMSVSLMVTDKAENETPVSFMIHVIDPDKGNVALFKPTTASTAESAEYPTQFVNDGNLKTRWSTEYKDDQWLTVDLQGSFRVAGVLLNWEAAFGKVYEILGSTDGAAWTVLASVADSDGGIDEVALTPSIVRYVKIHGIKRGTEWGFSLWELDVQGERVLK
jgi:hypothetical protein